MQSFRIQNIKSFIDSGTIEIRPITVFIGRNSSGKSSLIRFPLVLKQSFNENFSGALTFNGEYVDYGNYFDVVYNHMVCEPITFTITLKSWADIWLFVPKQIVPEIENRLDQIIVKNKPISLTIQIENFIEENLGQLRVRKFELSQDKTILQFTNTGKNSYNIMTEHFHGKTSLVFTGFFPGRISMDISKEDLFLLELSVLRYVRYYFQNVLQGIRYIGPFRTSPQRDYRVNEGKYISVGKDGIAAPHILAQKYLQNDQLFLGRVNSWMVEHLHTSLDVNILEGNRFEIFVTDILTGRKANLVDVGFGISQVLPIIIQNFFQNEIDNASLPILHMIEQPEIHLHPSAQSSLADLFIQGYQTNPSNKFLIETHSRNLILRLRRRIAEGVIPAEDVLLYYVQNGGDSGQPSQIQRLDIDQIGEIPDWPDEFFDQAYRDVLAIKAAQSLRENLQDEDDTIW